MIVEVLRVDLDAAPPMGDGWLSPEELRRAEGFLHPPARERFVVGRMVTRWVLASRSVAAHPRSVTIRLGANGRPEAPGAEFSISHSADRVLVAVGSTPVGVDVEWDRRRSVCAGLIARCATPEEIAAGADAASFTALWAAKEACLKAAGLGLAVEPTSFAAPWLWNAGAPALVCAPPGHPVAALGVCWFDVGSDYRAAVAAPGTDWTLRLRRLDHEEIEWP